MVTDSGASVDSSTVRDTGTIGLDTATEEISADDTGADTGAIDSVVMESAVDTAVVDAPSVDSGPPDIAKARIHEVYVDRALEGDKVEYVEISAPAATPLENLWLRVLDKAGAPVLELRVADAGAKMNASGLWVVGTIGITKVDKSYSLSAWGLPNDGGSIQLLRKDLASTLVDVVGYGAAAATGTADPKKTVEGTAAALPASDSTKKTIGRKSVPGDTDNNGTDFCVMAATPGAANGPCL